MLAVEAHHEGPALGAQRLQRGLARLLEFALKPWSQPREKRLGAGIPAVPEIIGRAGYRARDRT